MLNRKTAIMIAITIATVVIGVSVTVAHLDYGGQQTSSNNSDEFASNLAIPPIPLLSEYDKPVNGVDEASTIVGYDVPYPTYLPEGYKIQGMYAYDDSVKMYAWDRMIDGKTRYKDFYYTGKGMIIYIYDISKRYSTAADEEEAKATGGPISIEEQMEEWVKEFEKYKAHKLTIDGYQCVAYDSQIVEDAIGRKVPLLAELNCLKDKLLIQIRAYLPESELIKVAESML
ncbi:MAG: hypothetical protein QXS95_04585 [Candidatus Nitrosocaldus sp.]